MRIMQNPWKILCILLIVAIAAAMFTSRPSKAQTYPRAVRVDSVREAEDTVFFVDGAGLEWTWNGVEDWQIGDIAALLMSDSGTPDYVYDDRILEARYGFSGFSAYEERAASW